MHAKTLEVFEPFADLDEKFRLVAAKLTRFENFKQGTKLFELNEEDAVEYFLSEGAIELVACDGVSKTLEAGDPAARFPLALLRPRKFSAVVCSKQAKIAKLELAILRQLRKNVPVVGDAFSVYSPFSTQKIDLSEGPSDADSIKHFLIGASTAIVENCLMLPSFDDVSGTIFNATQDPDISLDSITRAVQLDLAITAKLIKAANSALFGGLPKVDSVRAAVVRLGLELTVQFVTLMVVKEVFHSSNKNLQVAMHKIWQSSLRLATFSIVIGRRTKMHFQQGQLLLAGLMNEIGSIVIVAYLDQFPGTANSISEHVLSSTRIKKKLGMDLLKHWGFPSSVVDVIEYSDDYERECEEIHISDVVCLARFLVCMTSYRKLPYAQLSDLPAFSRLGLDFDDNELIVDLQQEVHRYMQLFAGIFDS